MYFGGVLANYGLFQDIFSPFIALHKTKIVQLGIARIPRFSFHVSYLLLLSDGDA